MVRCPNCGNEVQPLEKFKEISYKFPWGIRYRKHNVCPICNKDLPTPPPPEVTSVREKTVEKEVIVKIRCPYCKNLYEETLDKCPHCGGKS